jgi:pilus assembly protein FimV
LVTQASWTLQGWTVAEEQMWHLAYGRDLQAEEGLKEAMRTTPQWVAIHAKQ